MSLKLGSRRSFAEIAWPTLVTAGILRRFGHAAAFDKLPRPADRRVGQVRLLLYLGVRDLLHRA